MSRLFFLMLVSIFACNQAQQQAVKDETSKAYSNVKVATSIENDSIPKTIKTEAEWKAELNKQEYYVLREKGTERSFTGDLWDHKEEGVYICRACQLPLFESGTKFKSGTGWPSFWKPIKDGHVVEESDTKYGMVRTEVLCASCDGHLGHVFDDGPQPTGLRYCINSVCLDFVKKK